MRICLIYDHIFPYTIGGAERWVRDLAVRLGEAGHDVTYLTMRHWSAHRQPSLDGVRVLGLVAPGRVYLDDRRALGPPVRFGLAVARHLAAAGATYDVVHTVSFPYFPLLAAGLLRRRHSYGLFVDWPEVWTRAYWHRYGGRLVGTAGWLLQRRCVRIPHTAFCMSHMHARRLVAEGYRGEPAVLPGLYAGPMGAATRGDVDRALVVYAGRHVREKRLDALLRGFARARELRPELRLEVYGDGPERRRLEGLGNELGIGTAVTFLGRLPETDVASAFDRAACVATASEREGYGLIVVEAAAHGTPSVIVAGPENAATELVHEGENGAVAESAADDDIARAIVRVIEKGPALRASTARWFEENAPTLRIERSLELVLESYERARAP